MSFLFKLFVIVGLIGCAQCHTPTDEEHGGHNTVQVGICTFFSATTLKNVGSVVLEQKGKEVEIKGAVNGLPPSAHIGFHVHSFGNFSDPDNMCNSNGPHFNPFNKTHGCKGVSKERHAGDLGNIETKADGTARISIKTKSISLSPGETNVLGRTIVIHMGMDDCGQGGNPGSLANGNSGTRIACCAIGVAACRFPL